MSRSTETDGREPETVPPVRLSAAGRLRSRLMVPVVLAVAVLVVALGWVLIRPAHPAARLSAAAPTADETTAVMRRLQAQATALTAHDRTAWNAGLDTSAAARTFTTHETAVFGNLAAVPLATWRYVLTAPVTDASVIGAAERRLGGRVVVLHVQLQYAFAVVDPAPTSRDLWLTAVLRDGVWKLAGDSDAASVGGPSWQGPWDFGRLIARRGPHTLVLVHPDHAADAATFQALVERSVPVVTSVWGSRWNDRVAVLIPDTATEFAAVTSDTGDSADLAAVAIADSVDPDGTVLGARIVLNPTNLGRLDAAGRRLVVQHELTHIASRADTADQMPVWLVEGLADYVGNLGSGLSAPSIAGELAAEVRAGKEPASLPTDADFDGADPRLPQVYEEAWLACRLISRRVGQSGLVRFYKAVSTAARTDPATSAAVGFRSVLHTDVAAFTAEWRAYVRAQLR